MRAFTYNYVLLCEALTTTTTTTRSKLLCLRLFSVVYFITLILIVQRKVLFMSNDKQKIKMSSLASLLFIFDKRASLHSLW
mmetsp:Transcript_35363/g.51813  ORF Transcript_35363/g.51813 Transcript_35363/m.51813 type:complete len:81 (-) Transcript_35363:191-433(-)